MLDTFKTYVVYQGNGLTKEFPIPFIFFENPNVVVKTRKSGDFEEIVLAENIDYTLVQYDNRKGALTLPLALQEGYELLVSLQVPAKQNLSLGLTTQIPSKSLEQQLDLLSAAVMILQDEQKLCINVSEFDSDTTPEQLLANIFTAEKNALSSQDESAQSALEAEESAKVALNAIQGVEQAGEQAIEAVSKATQEQIQPEVAKAQNAATSAEDSAQKAEEAAHAAAGETNITTTIRPVTEAVDYLAPSEKAVAEVVEEFNAQRLWKGTQAEFDALPNKDDYFLSYIIDLDTLFAVYSGSTLIYGINPQLGHSITLVMGTTNGPIVKYFSSVELVEAWAEEYGYTVKGMRCYDPSGIISDGENLFRSFVNLTYLDITGLNTSSWTSMVAMCAGLKKLVVFDAQGIDLSNIIDLRSTFYSCISLKELNMSLHSAVRLKYLGSTATNTSGFIQICSSLEDVDLSLNTSHNQPLASYAYMCSGCTSLKKLDLSTWTTDEVVSDGGDYFVQACTSITEAYGRSAAVVERMNGYRGKPDNVNFIVKP